MGEGAVATTCCRVKAQRGGESKAQGGTHVVCGVVLLGGRPGVPAAG